MLYPLGDKIRIFRIIMGIILIIVGVLSLFAWLRGDPTVVLSRPQPPLQFEHEPWRTITAFVLVGIGVLGVRLIIDTLKKIKKDRRLTEL